MGRDRVLRRGGVRAASPKNLLYVALLLAPLLVRAQHTPATPIVAELTPAQRQVVDTGGQLFVTRQVRGASWPRTLVYRYVDASPEEAAAVFTDYERQWVYIPELKKSRVVRTLDRVTVEVDYTLDIPVLPDEDYTVRDRLQLYDVAAAPSSAPAYRVDWTFVRAASTKSIVGNVRFEPHHNAAKGRAGTLMAYDNFVVPGSAMADLGFVRRQAMKQVQATVKAIAREVERQRRQDPAALRRNVERLRQSLAADGGS